MTGGSSARDGEVEALVVDRYLESLLARRVRDTTDVPWELQDTAEALTAGLPRYHPSFRFEEALAIRLASAVPGPVRADVTDRSGALVAFPRPVAPSLGPAMSDDRAVRPVVIGGVLTSAALSLAGAAWVAWRRGHPAADPMSRAVRAVSRARIV